MMWFEKLTGFKEINPEQVRQNLVLKGTTLTSLVNGQQYNAGQLEVPTLDALRQLSPFLERYDDRIKLSEVVGNVQLFHQDVMNEGALFQAASQFNLLEMVSPHITPEQGVGIYENDPTQGPACAIACGAGTIYRNYFAEVDGQMGQTAYQQIDCLDEMALAFQNKERHLWEMKNGYALATVEGLQHIFEEISQKTPEAFEALKGKLKIGMQWNTAVTIGERNHTVTQAYCSALPVAYSSIPSALWKDFAILILEATYEATFYAALKNYETTGNNRVYLTLVGGGVFGNELEWILDAIRKSVIKFRNTPLDVKMVSYGSSNLSVNAFVETTNF